MKTIRALATLNKYFWRYKKHLLLGFLVVIITNIFSVLQPSQVRLAISAAEKYLANPANGTTASHDIVYYSLMIILFAIISGIFLFLARQTLIVMSHLVVNDLRNDVFSHLQELPLPFYRRSKTGDLMARVSEDISRVRMYVGPGVMYNLNTGIKVLIVVPMMIYVSPELAFYALLPLPVLSIAIYLVESLVNEKSDRIQTQLSKLSSFTQEIFSSIRLVKGYSREKDVNEKMAREAQHYKDQSMDLAKLESLFHPLVLSLVGISNLLVVWIGGRMVMKGQLEIAVIAEFLLYVNMLTWPIISLGWVTTLIQRAAASQNRIVQLMKEQPEFDFPETGPEIELADIVFDKVSFTYPETGIAALKEVSFQIKPGQKLGIIGPTGSGKTTLCHFIPRLLDPDSGAVRIQGVNLKEYTKETLRSSIGYSPQDVFLFSDSLSENIAFGMESNIISEVESAAKDASVYENIKDFPKGFDTMIGERGVTLSGGQKQRVAIARAMIRKPKVLILDDSLSAVDTNTEENILEKLRQARKDDPGMAVIMVSHRISALQDSDKIIVIQDGQITESGTHPELMEARGYYAGIYKKQLIEKELEDVG